MPGFNYTAIDRNGKRVRSSLDASSIETAKSSLRGAGYTILDIKEQTTLNRDIEIPFLGKPKAKDMAVFCRQFVSILRAGVSVASVLAMLVDAEWSARKSNRLTGLIKKAGYADTQASVENIEYIAERHLDREQILRLASCSYIQEARNVIILGATGAGKTFLACSLGVAANRNFYAARYLRLPDLLVEIAVARRDGTYREYMKQLKKVKLLILDEWLLYPLKEAEARDVLELVEARNKVASTIFCSQYDTSEWHENLYDPTLADAICDRIIYNAYTVQIEGESMRKRMGMPE